MFRVITIPVGGYFTYCWSIQFIESSFIPLNAFVINRDKAYLDIKEKHNKPKDMYSSPYLRNSNKTRSVFRGK